VQLGPSGAAIERGPDRELGSCQEQIRILNVLSQAVRRAPREVAFEGFPTLAEIIGDVDQRIVIIGAMAVEGDIGAAFLEVRWLDGGDVAGTRQADILGDIRPFRATIASYP